jgi:16S rRNA (cytosine1402-N4)-methyltransferase
VTDHTSVQPAAEARPPEHVTVMPDEVAELLAGVPDGVIVDGTLGRGGHTKVLLGRGRTGLRILGLDRDLEAVEASRRILEPFGDRVRILHRGYEELREIVRELQLALLPGIILDLGLSSVQLASDRGFSFRPGQPLDMRFNPDGDDPTAAELIADMPENELAQRLWELAEVPAARRLAKRLKERSRAGRLETTDDLVAACTEVLGPRVRKMASATLPAQALRMMVNGELDRLTRFLDSIPEILAPNGRVVILSFHSGEDRLVKTAFRRYAATGDFRMPVRKALRPGSAEVAANRRARSAKCRVLERCGEEEVAP